MKIAMNSALEVLCKAQMLLPDRRMFSPESEESDWGLYVDLLNTPRLAQMPLKHTHIPADE